MRDGRLLWCKGGLEVPDGEFDFVPPVGESLSLWCQAPFTQTHGQCCGSGFCTRLSQWCEAEGAIRSARINPVG
jgi:hypothetical protein